MIINKLKLKDIALSDLLCKNHSLPLNYVMNKVLDQLKEY